MAKKREFVYHYEYRNGEKVLILPSPRSTNEIFVSEDTIGTMPCNEKDASKFSLSTVDSCMAALESLYGPLTKKVKGTIQSAIKK